ncbi:P-loop containing nucleoside triphosphate hydrolase protein [Amylostereum chailletii]|nr:P-loop containing nucleoside triphosphate hydrolase protein [Amylostereum chailletii]
MLIHPSALSSARRGHLAIFAYFSDVTLRRNLTCAPRWPLSSNNPPSRHHSSHVPRAVTEKSNRPPPRGPYPSPKKLRTPHSQGSRTFQQKRSQNFWPTSDRTILSPGADTATRLLHRLQSSAPRWAAFHPLRDRLARFGLGPEEVHRVVSHFVDEMAKGEAWKPGEYSQDHIDRLWRDVSTKDIQPLDQALTSIFFSWMCDPRNRNILLSFVSERTLENMTRLRNAVDFTRLPEFFPLARSMRRKVIMHVGPTNSGKTHNALRALAAARVGVYAGPLRLLAHEIYERLNTGQIVPLGADPAAEPQAEPDTDSNFDIDPTGSRGVVIRKVGDPRYVVRCNLFTGEERRLVEGATVLSCTVEMCNPNIHYDVAVVDEIQMIADTDRGNAWTTAVLGLAASELHLCGEETAVPIVQELLKMTGDELVVNRYQRLSPLHVAEESLGYDLSKIRKGDCVVTFSRSGIFSLKSTIEKKTGLRCAVIYGRLPPEIRSEQAALFNDPDSGYDVMVASDAIGMGLNLKIRRVVFEQVSKYDGQKERLLAPSQIKQIAGRAGRYGLHGKDEAGGVATTLYPSDLPVLAEALAAPFTPLRYAQVGFVLGNTFSDIMAALPPNSDAITASDALFYVSSLPPMVAMAPLTPGERMTTAFLDSRVKDHTYDERGLFLQVPIQYRDPPSREVIGDFVDAYARKKKVDPRKLLAKHGMLQTLNAVLEAREAQVPPQNPDVDLQVLESMHKTLVSYCWLFQHHSVAFYAYDQATALMKASEQAMDWCLRTRAQTGPESMLKMASKKLGFMRGKSFKAQDEPSERIGNPSMRPLPPHMKEDGLPSKPLKKPIETLSWADLPHLRVGGSSCWWVQAI